MSSSNVDQSINQKTSIAPVPQWTELRGTQILSVIMCHNRGQNSRRTPLRMFSAIDPLKMTCDLTGGHFTKCILMLISQRLIQLEAKYFNLNVHFQGY